MVVVALKLLPSHLALVFPIFHLLHSALHCTKSVRKCLQLRVIISSFNAPIFTHQNKKTHKDITFKPLNTSIY